VVAAGSGRFQHGGKLRHTDAGNDARGADAARANADFHRIHASLDQGPSAFGRGDVAGNDLNGVGGFLDRLDSAQHPFRVAVRGIHHDHIRLRRDQRPCSDFPIRADAGRGGGAQAAEFVLVGQRV
jgi:hypothetical protein